MLLAVGTWILVAVLPAWRRLFPDTRDYATFATAVQVWQRGGNPYDLSALEAAAPPGTTVYPFFYPPPSLPLLAWTGALPLKTGYRLMFWLNELALGGVLWILWRWFRPPPWLLVVAACTWTPVSWSGRLGQVNVIVLLLCVAAMWRSRGSLLAAAAVIKMSPALLAARWVARGSWRPVFGAFVTAVAAHLAALPWVPLALQRRFYLEVLPQFASGAYNGLDVPISLPANHSLANLLDQVWPGPDAHHLSPTAATVTRVLLVAGLLGLSWVGRRRVAPVGEGLLTGSLLVLMTIAPVFAYEHHLVFLLPAAVAAATAIHRRALPRSALLLLVPAWAAVVLPIEEFRHLQRTWPAAAVYIRESKLAGALTLGLLCAWGAARCREQGTAGRRSRPPTSAAGHPRRGPR